MKLTKNEAGVAWQSLNVTDKGQQKTFPIGQLMDAGKVCAELKAKCIEGETFVDSKEDIELDTDCKKLLKDCLEREWPATLAENVISLKEKLS